MKSLSKLSLCSLVAFTSVLAASAQSTPAISKKYKQTADQLIQAALKDDSAYSHLTYLCDHIGKRLSGTESLNQAIDWSVEVMKQEGLSNVHVEPVMVPHWVRGSESATITAPIQKPLHMLGLGMSVATPPEGITAEVIVVPDFESLSALKPEEVKGKIVVFNAPYKGYGQTVMYRTAGASRAAALGAVGVLVRSITPLALQTPHTGTLSYQDGQPKIPAAAISIEDALLLERLTKENKPVTVHLKMEAHMEPDAKSANVIGEIPGSEHPEEVVVLGGHSDSWDVGQGAQDDGSGIMATLGAVSLIHKLNLHPKRTIRLVFWVNEENGGAGGRAYSNSIGDKVEKHVAAIEMDGGAEKPLGIGYGRFGGPRRGPNANGGFNESALSAEEKNSFAILREIASLLEPVGANSVSPGGGGSDIEPIVSKGVPSLSPHVSGEHYFDWHHTEADTLDKVNLEDFRKNEALLSVLSYILADIPEKLAGRKQ